MNTQRAVFVGQVDCLIGSGGRINGQASCQSIGAVIEDNLAGGAATAGLAKHNLAVGRIDGEYIDRAAFGIFYIIICICLYAVKA